MINLMLIFDLIIFTSLDSLKKDNKDYFFSEDKLKHFYFNLMLTNFLYFESYYSLKLKEKKALYISSLIPFSLSLSKEIWDTKKKKLFSVKDLLWDMMGIVLGIYITYTGFK